MDKIVKTIAEELNIKTQQVENTIKLIDEGNTIPFIARYRKEVTGGLSDELLRRIELGEIILNEKTSWRDLKELNIERK